MAETAKMARGARTVLARCLGTSGLVGLMAGGLGAPSALYAQTASPATASPATTLPEIVVFGGARDERALLETPNAVSVIEEEQFIRRQASTYEELIGDLPGVSIEGGPRGIAQEPNIRGFTDDQVVIRVDGARQNFTLTHRGRFFTDPSILKRVEVLRGGASTLFGSGALGGVIFLETKDPDDVILPGRDFGGQVKLGFNSAGTELLGAGTVAARAGDFDALAHFAGRPRFDDIDDGNGDPILRSDIDTLNGLVKLGWEPGEGNRIELSYQIYDDDGQTPPDADGPADADLFNVVERDVLYQTGRIAWDYAPPGNDLLDLSLLAYINDIEVTEDRISDDRLDTTDFRTLGFEATNISRFELGSVPVAVSYGVEVFTDRQDAERDGDARLQAPDARRNFFAGFIQADFEVLPGLTITPGIRYDYFQLRPDGAFDDREEGQPSPRLAVNWQPNETMQFFASASRSFRAPTLTELYVDGQHFFVGEAAGEPLGNPFDPSTPFFSGSNEFISSPDLDPERATHFEIGGRFRDGDVFLPGDSLLVSGNAYYSIVDDFIDTSVLFVDFQTFRFDPTSFNPFTQSFGRFLVDGTTTNFNVDAVLYGFEGEIDYDAGSWFAAAGITIPRGRQRNGAGELASIPQDRLVLTGGIRPIPDVELGLRGTFRRGINEDDVPEDTITTGGSAVFDLFANWQPSDGPLEGAVFSAGIDNFTDRAYSIHANELNDPGIAVKVSASIAF
ncbi:MAG: TonB-dependent receptor [Pseudomonadota bacterium]